MKPRLLLLLALPLLLISTESIAGNKHQRTEPLQIVAHRGFWDCDEGGHAQNSVASLKAAQDHHFWGSEFDVQLTKDGYVVSNHDKEYGPEKMVIIDHTLEELRQYTLPNGEELPTLEQYLEQGTKSQTVLVLEFKTQRTEGLCDELIAKTLEQVKAAGLYDPARICFISFSKYICKKVAAECPEFTVEYLMGTMSAKEMDGYSIGGDDCNIVFHALNPNRVKRLHKKGLKSNVWTIDSEKHIANMVKIGVDQITTNNPLGARAVLEELNVPEEVR